MVFVGSAVGDGGGDVDGSDDELEDDEGNGGGLMKMMNSIWGRIKP